MIDSILRRNKTVIRRSDCEKEKASAKADARNTPEGNRTPAHGTGVHRSIH